METCRRCNVLPLCVVLMLYITLSSASDSVRLSEVQVLTLYNNKMTNARRSSPIPQIKCVGGTAGCNKFVPQVVQCYNRGSDGFDVQWECKTDMDNAYRFGRIMVSCEGYNYPDDPYILRHSCGLEYTLDLTEEGQQKGSNSHHSRQSWYPKQQDKSSSVGNLVMVVIVGLIVFAVYRTCTTNHDTRYDQSTTNDDDDGYPAGGGGTGGPRHRGTAPPPPGFRPEYSPGSDTCGGNRNAGQGQNQGGGFWSGAALGALGGYLFGNQNRQHGYHHTRPGYSGYDSFGYRQQDTYSSGWGSGSSSGSTSSGTRTASGFGGTSRR